MLQTKGIMELNRETFEGMRKECFTYERSRTGLELMREKARHELTLRQSYSGRAPYEILQNADDAGASKAVYVLSDDGMAFLHDGQWFTPANFLALAEGWSDKNPEQCIGHKGLGFRSVLGITPSPHLIRVDGPEFFGVRFSWSLNKGYIDQTLHQQSDLRPVYENWSRGGNPACPVMCIPGLVKKSSLGTVGSLIYNQVGRGRFGNCLTTMFWFPSTDDNLQQPVERDLGAVPLTLEAGTRTMLDFLTVEVGVILPFLKNVREVSLYCATELVARATLAVERGTRERTSIVSVSLQHGPVTKKTTLFLSRITKAIPQAVKSRPDSPTALRSLRSAQIAVGAGVVNGCLVEPPGSARFHVYFPTTEATGTKLLVHADYYVKPDRTSLIDSGYNEWLLGEAADLACGEFLTEALRHFDPRSVLEAFAPRATSGASRLLVALIKDRLQKRVVPFIPGLTEMLCPKQTVLPPVPAPFWSEHFTPNLETRGKHFIDPACDTSEVRLLLSTLGVERLSPLVFLEYLEEAHHADPEWWCECFGYAARHPVLGQLKHGELVGRKILPGNNGLIAVDGSDGTLVSLPPDNLRSWAPPRCMLPIFDFLDPRVARLLAKDQQALFWLANSCHVSRYEASELIPRIARHLAPRFFDSSWSLSVADLTAVWKFIFEMLNASRSVDDPGFWATVSRLPVPVEGWLEDQHLLPAFLAFLPDAHAPENSPLRGVPGLPRVDEAFLSDVLGSDKVLHDINLAHFVRSGVVWFPKTLAYQRIVTEPGVMLSSLPARVDAEFSGERQRDENLAVRLTIGREGILRPQEKGSATLRNLTLIYGLRECVQQAALELESGGEAWRRRLGSLVQSFVDGDLKATPDQADVRSSSSTLQMSSYVAHQLAHYPWIPTTLGPRPTSEAFLRTEHGPRFITSRPLGYELGDQLLAYYVCRENHEAGVLSNLGIELLEAASQAMSRTLARFLQNISTQASTIHERPGAWRFVRGAIQETYRVLNQKTDWTVPNGLKLARRQTQLGEPVSFTPHPMYYAEAGSIVEQAFASRFPMIDSDHLYESFFARAGIAVLRIGTSVEQTIEQAESRRASLLEGQVKAQIWPYLSAAVAAKWDRARTSNIERRIADQCSFVRVASLVISLTTLTTPVEKATICCSNFYVDRTLIQRSTAISEARYTVFVVGEGEPDALSPSLDADALGDALAKVFADEVPADVLGLFPRIVSRFQMVLGNRTQMIDYLNKQLNVSLASVEEGYAAAQDASTGSIPAPPPPVAIKRSLEHHSGTDEVMRERTEEAVREVQTALSSVGRRHVTTHPIRLATDSAVARGLAGEEEFLRRVTEDGGWVGLTLVQDCRAHSCGFDFLCSRESGEVEVELKTATPSGDVYLTTRELHEMHRAERPFLLVVLLDNGDHPWTWQLYTIADAAQMLYMLGKYEIDTRLRVPVKRLLGLVEV